MREEDEDEHSAEFTAAFLAALEVGQPKDTVARLFKLSVPSVDER